MIKYREIGFKLTPQRLAILDFLHGSSQHPSADDIYRAVLKKFPTISFATVYATLAALKKRGKLAELSSDPHKKRYDPDTRNHSHLICSACNRIFDIPVEYTIVFPESVKQDFVISDSHVECTGLCPTCKINASNKTVNIRSEKTARNEKD
jgi:Fur family transcriptional regulator, peroxide stress response regulator